MITVSARSAGGAPAPLAASAQTYVTPKLGGGQTTAEMVHIDVYYDQDANTLYARVDDSYGLPESRPLQRETAFDPAASWSVFNGKANNAQYGWRVGGFFTPANRRRRTRMNRLPGPLV
jgi:hypothetical protein